MIILTDLSEVLIKGMYGTEKFIEERYGRKYARQYLHRRKEIDSIFQELMRGHFSEDTYWQVFLQEKKWPFDAGDLKAFLSLNLAEAIPGTLSVYLRITSYPDSTDEHAFRVIGRPEIWCVSDHIAEREEEIEYLHPEFNTLFSKYIWSFKQAKLKADVGFFQELLAHYNLFPSDVIFIDDMLDNVCSAASAGITSIRFINAKQLESTLESLGFGFAHPVKSSNVFVPATTYC